MKTSVIGFPRIGKLRELKFASEKYFRGEITEDKLQETAKSLREEHWTLQKEAGIDYISSGDFSFYDGMLDTAVLLNAIPKRYRALNLSDLDTYFAMARGYQGEHGDVTAFAMKKWFNTNYHYMVPELSDDTKLSLNGTKLFDEYTQAKENGIETKPVVIGPFTFLKLAKTDGTKKAEDFAKEATQAYIEILEKLQTLGAQWVQFDEPFLVTDLTKEDVAFFTALYQPILEKKGNLQVLLQTYFGDIRDAYQEVVSLDFDGIGLDFKEGKQTLALLQKNGFPEDKILFAGLINGKNIWKANAKDILETLDASRKNAKQVVLSTTCSLLHVPFTLENETKLEENVRKHFSFAKEKLVELHKIAELAEQADVTTDAFYQENQALFAEARQYLDADVQASTKNLKAEDFTRKPVRSERKKIQKEEFKLPLFPTTTIGSFPQTAEVKRNRSRYKKGEIDQAAYEKQIDAFISDCIKQQEALDIDVLVHGEYERNDMVEFFGENLAGYVFTEKAWVQSYGTRCVKPPIIFGDIKRVKPITVATSKYAQSLTDRPVKGMLTGPVTILNWSFPREDISLQEMAYQIGIAIRDEVLDLEAAGIRMIQIDEAALKEKLPIRRGEWYEEYLDWAIPAFRLCHSKVKPETQIHTHMCYSEFDEIVADIDRMDADVISFEASRSKLTILDALNKAHFETEVGPGVYDIHSPRVPSVEELTTALEKIIEKIEPEHIWVNPDCGLKTRGIPETIASLKNMVEAARIVRKKYQ